MLDVVGLKNCQLAVSSYADLTNNDACVCAFQVYQQSIAAVCNLDWPKSKLLIQVLDDSDDQTAQLLIKEEVQKWQQEGANILYRHRVIRDGYKAGNLKSAMNCNYVKDYEFVAIFDADFQPTPDFLKKTVPHFKVLNSVEVFVFIISVIVKYTCCPVAWKNHGSRCVMLFRQLIDPLGDILTTGE